MYANHDHDHDWMEALAEQRRMKDRYFGEDPRSPLSPEERAAFEGLDYYAIDPDYRFEVELHVYDDPRPVVVATSTDGEQEYLAWGEFAVEIEGERVTVTAYRSDRDLDRMWVPFRDETSGEETYGAGRYMDLEPDHHLTDEGRWILDFNEAYNPTCAYSDRYECPLPPMENWLDVRVEAGERAYDHP